MERKMRKAEEESTRLHGQALDKFKNIAANLAVIGKDENNNDLVYCLKSEKNHIFRYYNMNPDEKLYIRDVRYPLPRDVFFNDNNPLNIIFDLQKESNNYEITDEDINSIEDKEATIFVNWGNKQVPIDKEDGITN
jgi:hypothetical protein